MILRSTMASLCILSVASLFAQDNVGIGTTSPSTNFKLHVSAGSNKSALLLESNGSGQLLFAYHTGTGIVGQFTNANTANPSTVLLIENSGTGSDVFVNSKGTAAAINVLKAAGSSGQGIYIDHQGGIGPVAQFRRTNAAGQGAAVIGYNNSNNSQSPAVYANHEGTGDAAMVARIANTGNPWSAVYGETNGTGAAIYGTTSGSGSAIFAVQSGTGRAGQFQIGNPSNTDAALRGFTNGLGRAGFFTVNNPASTASGVYAESNASGPVIEARSTAGNNGVAFKLTEGGLQVSVETVATAGNIAKKAVVYHLQAAGAYTTTFTLNDGDVFFFFNSNAAPATINGLLVAAGAGINCIVIAGTLRQI